jgi:hypothetical protein
MAGGSNWRRAVGLCGPAVLLSLADWALTLAGQPAAYWAGDYSRAYELSPTFHWLLAAHPALFLAGVLAWVGVFAALILLLPDPPAAMLSVAVAFGHTNGAASWVMHRSEYPYQTRIALVCLTSALAGFGVWLAYRGGPERTWADAMTAWLRWALIAALLAVAAYLFLVPRW